MARRANPALIGAFVVAGLVLLAGALVLIAGNDLFARKDRAVMYFRGSIYGLQVGAPVVFRGVRVGSVTSIEVVHDAPNDRFVIPVLAELDRDAVRGIDGSPDGRPAPGDPPPLVALVQRGLRAQLQMQSLLTGQLYVDIDIRPPKPQPVADSGAADPPLPPNPVVVQNATEIPTTDTAVQALKNQLDGLDIRRLLDDVATIAGSARAIVAGPELHTVMNDLQAITGSVRRLSTRLDQRIEPLLGAAQGTLARADQAALRIGDALGEVGQTARSLARTAGAVDQVLAPDSALMLRLQEAAAQVSQTAAALQVAADNPDGLVRQTQRTMQDLSRAARSLRELADSLERQPQSLLRGRPPEDASLPEPGQ